MPARVVFRHATLDVAVLEVRGVPNIPSGARVLTLVPLDLARFDDEPARVIGFPRSNREPWRDATTNFVTLSTEGAITIVRTASDRAGSLDDGLSGGPVVVRERTAGLYLGIARGGESQTGRFVSSTNLLNALAAFVRNGVVAQGPNNAEDQFALVRKASDLVNSARGLLRRGNDEVALLLLRQALAYAERGRGTSLVAPNAYDVFTEFLSKSVASHKLPIENAPQSVNRGTRSLLLGSEGNYSILTSTSTGRVDTEAFPVFRTAEGEGVRAIHPDALALYDNDRKAVAISGRRILDCTVKVDGAYCNTTRQVPNVSDLRVHDSFVLVPAGSSLPKIVFRRHDANLHMLKLSISNSADAGIAMKLEPYLDILTYDGALSCVAVGTYAHHQAFENNSKMWLMNAYGLINVFDLQSGLRTRVHHTFFQDCANWDAMSDTHVMAVAIHEPTRSVALSQRLGDGTSHLLVGRLDRDLAVEGLQRIEAYCSYRDPNCHESPPRTLDWSSDGALLAVGTSSLPGGVRIYDATIGFRPVVSDDAAHSSVTAIVRFMPRTSTLISASGTSSGISESVAYARSWIVRESASKPKGIDDRSKSFAFSRDGKLFVAAGHNEPWVGVYDGINLDVLGHIPMAGLDREERMSFSLAFGENAGLLYSGSTRGRISRWQLPDSFEGSDFLHSIKARRKDIGRIEADSRRERPAVRALAISHKTGELFSCDGDGNVLAWNLLLETRARLHDTIYGCNGIAASDDGSVVAVAAGGSGCGS